MLLLLLGAMIQTKVWVSDTTVRQCTIYIQYKCEDITETVYGNKFCVTYGCFYSRFSLHR